jgi:hypothetical protein
MMYCTKCGSNLKGSRVTCPTCGYEVMKMKMDLLKPKTVRSGPSVEEEVKPWAPPIPDQRDRRASRPPRREMSIREEKVHVKEEIPRPKPEIVEVDGEEVMDNDPRYVDGCSICGGSPVHRCFFTLAPLCEKHTVYMQIDVRGMAFGEKVPSSSEIANMKNGRPPTQAEAQEAGMFFSIKPYHEWKRVKP